MCLSVYLSLCLSFHLSICKLENEAILRNFLNLWTWQHQKRSNSARLSLSLYFLIWQRQNQNKSARLPNFRSWQHQKGNNSVRLPSKMESWEQSWRPCTTAFCDFLSIVLRLPRKSEARLYEVPHLSRKIILANLWRSDAPKCSPSQDISALTS